MKRVLIVLAVLVVIGCGRAGVYVRDGVPGEKGDKGDKGDPGSSCHVTSNLTGVTVSCDDGTNSDLVNGLDAVPCSVNSVPGGVQVSCPDGSTQTVLNGIDGTNGSDGQDGVQGNTGSQGPQGNPGTVITSVQFCDNPGNSHHFPEVGFCVANKLYAVYWDGHNSWMAEIGLGNYISTATGLTCTFSVGSNCSVSH